MPSAHMHGDDAKHYGQIPNRCQGREQVLVVQFAPPAVLLVALCPAAPALCRPVVPWMLLWLVVPLKRCPMIAVAEHLAYRRDVVALQLTCTP